jgi:hypothetical protein
VRIWQSREVNLLLNKALLAKTNSKSFHFWQYIAHSEMQHNIHIFDKYVNGGNEAFSPKSGVKLFIF